MTEKNGTSTKIITALSILSTTLISCLIVLIYFYGSELWEWIKYTSKFGDFTTAFASIASLSASAVVAYFGYQISKAQKDIAFEQKEIAKNEFKSKIFNERYEIYRLCFYNLNNIIYYYHHEEDIDHKFLKDFKYLVPKARFIFNKETGDFVETLLKKIRYVYTMIQEEKKDKDKNEILLCILKSNAGGDANFLIAGLKENLERLPEHFETFLKIEI